MKDLKRYPVGCSCAGHPALTISARRCASHPRSLVLDVWLGTDDQPSTTRILARGQLPEDDLDFQSRCADAIAWFLGRPDRQSSEDRVELAGELPFPTDSDGAP